MLMAARGNAARRAATARGKASGKARATEQSFVNADQCVTIAYANIDWKAGRHGRNFRNKHAPALTRTVQSIVAELAPAVLCLCEVGEVKTPLDAEQMDAVFGIVREAWEQGDAAATEHCLQGYHVVGEPYMTVFRSDLVACSDFRMLHGLYWAGSQPRSAQHFLVRQHATEQLRGDDGIDVVNVHAPSGTATLKDSQRRQLLRTLMTTTSLRRSGGTLGFARFIIGGDMNSSELTLLQMMGELHSTGVCASTMQRVAHRAHDDDGGDEASLDTIWCWRPMHGKHGDVGLVRGLRGCAVSKIAINHDPQHCPYAFRWLPSALARTAERATEQLLAVPKHPLAWPAFAKGSTTLPQAEGGSAPTAAGKAAALGAPAQQPLHGTTAGVRATEQQQSVTTFPKAEGGPAPSAAGKAASAAAPAPVGLPPASARPQQVSAPPAAPALPVPGTAGGMQEDDSGDEPPATEQRPPQSVEDAIAEAEEARNRTYPRAILHAFMKEATGSTELNDADEEAIENALEYAEGWASEEDFENIKDMFESIFIYYPHGLREIGPPWFRGMRWRTYKPGGGFSGFVATVAMK